MKIKQFTGCIPSKMDLRNYRIAKSSKKVSLPSEFEVHHSHIKDQGEVNSCVAHSVSEVLEARDGINYSTEWIYGYRTENSYQGEGMTINTAVGTIYKEGYIKNEILPQNVEMVEAKEIVDANLDMYKAEANRKKISAYAYLKTPDEVKEAIYRGGLPVIMSIEIDKGGLKLDRNNIAKVPTIPYGLHAVVCYGWNEKGFLIQNSWGEEWGNKGTFILPYTYIFDEAWALMIYEKGSDLEIKKPNLYAVREFIMKIVKILRKIADIIDKSNIRD